VLIAALPDGLLNETYWGGWTGIMFRNAVMRLISHATHVLPIDQSSHHLANLALDAAVLARGNKLIWFPEGGRSRNGALQPFQPGISLILTAHPTPIGPVRISGELQGPSDRDLVAEARADPRRVWGGRRLSFPRWTE
jgi:long-chain acyl-CoA synthetase